MTPIHRFRACLLLLFAFAMGQGAVVLHDLEHAVNRIHADSRHSLPAPDNCSKCSAMAQLSGAAPAFVAAVALSVPRPEHALFTSTPAQSRTVVSSRSRAPPSAS
jgi:hypothetical protein